MHFISKQARPPDGVTSDSSEEESDEDDDDDAEEPEEEPLEDGAGLKGFPGTPSTATI